jgi:primosomal protein N' (replication factor Y) (superfamily II helicase)
MQTLFGSLEPEPENPPENAGLVQVLVPAPVDRTYTYAVPAGLAVAPGDYVSVPLGKREMAGVVWGKSREDILAKKLKSIIARSTLPPMPEKERQFIDWVADYTMSPAGMVLKMALSVPDALKEEKATMRAFRLADWAGKALAAGGSEAQRLLKNLSPSKRKVLALLQDGKSRRAAEIGVSSPVLKGLGEAGLVEAVDIFPAAPCRDPDIGKDGPALSADQAAAARHLCRLVQEDSYHAALLDGVTPKSISKPWSRRSAKTGKF